MPQILNRAIRWIKYTAIPWYTSLGFTKGTIMLEVRGRKSGKPIKVSVTTVKQAGERYVVSLYDQSQWLQNLRAAELEQMQAIAHRYPVFRIVSESIETYTIPKFLFEWPVPTRWALARH